jgi:zinc transport system substrate-binding protein
MARLDTLVDEVSNELAPVKGKGFIVFHDAYQYFEKRFGVPASGSITVSPEVVPGAKRVSEIRGKVQQLGAACVFAEPQFEPKLVSTVIEGTQARSGACPLDPLGDPRSLNGRSGARRVVVLAQLVMARALQHGHAVAEVLPLRS